MAINDPYHGSKPMLALKFKGNEQADKLAKQGTQLKSNRTQSTLPIAPIYITNAILNFHLPTHLLEWPIRLQANQTLVSHP